MKLLFDQNVSPRLPLLLADLFPSSSHVVNENLNCATDEQVWLYAKKNNFTIITKDEDFNNLSMMLGFPPKIIWVTLGNCTTLKIEASLRNNFPQIEAFGKDPELGTFLVG